MPCFPPLWPVVRRVARGLFKRTGQAETSTSPPPSSATELSPPTLEKGKDRDIPDLPQKALVCQYCWDTGLFAPGPFQEAWVSQTLYTGFSYTTAWTQLEASSDKCHWCRLVLSTRNEAMFRDSVHVAVGFRAGSTSNTISPKGVQTLRLVIDDAPHSLYYVYTDRDDPAAALLVARTRVLQLNSPSARTMASDCIMDCIRKHDRCPAPHSAALPTRVVDCSDPTKPKLHLGNGEKAPYVALSYVRGEYQPYNMTTGNLANYLLEIDLDVLPQTIKDAIETTHAMGVRYLWVDTLCILQDSEEDEVHEIAQMRSIFRNAYFTIVAASAAKVSDGFLQDRPPPSPPDISLPFRCPDGEIGTMWLSPVWRQYDGLAEPVNQRAWCLEERLLSPRALVYASHTLQFQCQSSIVNVGNAVCGPMIRPRLPDLLFRDPPPTLSHNDRKMLRWAWIEVVGDYTHRALTRPDDKLVAFAAIAEAFHRLWGCEYLAGLWRDTLLQDVLWYKTFETRYPRPAEYRAPSWSWAAVDGRVMAYSVDDRLDPETNETEACEIVRCEAVTASEILPFGRVKEGTLTLRAAMLRATWTLEASMPDLYLQSSEGILHASEASAVDSTAAAAPEPIQIHIGCAYPDSVENVQEVWAVPVQWNRAAQYAAGLIVTRAATNEQFRRVGYFHSPEGALSGLSWLLDKEPEVVVLV